MMSDAPLMNLVSECTTTSAPQVMGETTMGVKVLSTTSWQPCARYKGGRVCACARAHTRARACVCERAVVLRMQDTDPPAAQALEDQVGGGTKCKARVIWTGRLPTHPRALECASSARPGKSATTRVGLESVSV